MDKKVTRKQQINRLKEYASTDEKHEEDRILTNKFIKLDAVKTATNIGVFISMNFEIDTSNIIMILWEMGKNVYLPKVDSLKTCKMNFIHYTYQSKLVKTEFGVQEIANSDDINNDLDLILVPGIAFSLLEKMRLGFGGGYYDRFLSDHLQSKKVALANSRMLFEKADWPIENFDIPVDILISK